MLNNRNNNKLLLLIIAVLVIANISMLVYFLQKSAPPVQAQRQDRKAYIADFLKKEIGFSTQQLAAYDTLSTRHRQRIGILFEKLRGNRGDQFNQMVGGHFTDSTINTIARESAATQEELELIMLKHLRNIRLLCTPDQVPKFDTSFAKALIKRSESRRKQTGKKLSDEK